MFTIKRTDPTGRLPPGQKVTTKFPVMTAGTPRITPAAEWTLTLTVETHDMREIEIARWDYGTISALPRREITCDIHCVTRWSKLDTRWRGVRVDDLLAAAGVSRDGAGVDASPWSTAPDDATPALPHAYVHAVCDGDYSTNLRLADLTGDAAFVALDYDDGDGFAPLPEAHGGPARLVVPKLYFWKSPKWLRRLTLTPYDRKGFWETLGYHNYGDPWKEQRYRGFSDQDFRTTLDPELSQQIRRERLRSGRNAEKE